jgi:hypothetical protein
MAALRKKYQGRADIAPKADSAPVISEPPARTRMPERDTSPPPHDLSVSEPEPVEEAGRAAILDRITELERAEAISQEPQPPQFAAEPPEQNPLEEILAAMPEGVRGWLRKRPQYLTDPEKNAQIQHAHLVAARESGDDEFGSQYYERLASSRIATTAEATGATPPNITACRAAADFRQRPPDAGQHFDVNGQTDRQRVPLWGRA